MRTRLLVILLVALMALGSLGLWIAIPIAWLWIARDLEPAGTRFVITITGCVLTMLGGGWLLYRLEAIYVRTTGKVGQESVEPAWLRSSREAGAPRPPLSLLEALLVASALAAVVALIAWWAFAADSPNPSGPLQPL